MTKFRQIALVSDNLADDARRLSLLGASTWVYDTVDAIHIWERDPCPTHAIPPHVDPTAFSVRLAFNYTLFPDKELELIQLLEGHSCQLTNLGRRGEPVVSHVGYHVADFHVDPDALEKEILYWHALGSPCAQVSQTVRHAGTTRRYRYAFVFDRHFPQPMWVKLIQRIGAEDEDVSVPSLDEGRLRFRSLSVAGAD